MLGLSWRITVERAEEALDEAQGGLFACEGRMQRLMERYDAVKVELYRRPFRCVVCGRYRATGKIHECR